MSSSLGTFSPKRNERGSAVNVPKSPQPSALMPDADTSKKFLGLALGFTSQLAQSFISHPFLVMRRQAQINAKATTYNLVPWQSLRVMYTIQRHQSWDTYGKGLTSRFLLQGIQVFTENVVSEATNLPKEVTKYSSLQKHSQHLLLKGIGLLLTTPLLASNFVETVQSEIGSDRLSILDLFREGGQRLLSWNTNETTRLLPIWSLVTPVVTLGLLRYMIMSMAQYTVTNTHQARKELRTGEDEVSNEGQSGSPKSDAFLAELLSLFAGSLLSDVILYPLETVVHRMLAQGTRIIIDNTETGIGVVPVTTRYTGFFSCLRGIAVDEGVSGLYKGFGALIAQYLLHAAIVKLADGVYRWAVRSHFDDREG